MELTAVAQCAAGAALSAAPPNPPAAARDSRHSSEPPGDAGGSGPSGGGAAGAAAVAAAAGPPLAAVPAEVEVYCQALFTLFDALTHWVTERTEEHEAVVNAGGGPAGTSAGTSAGSRAGSSSSGGGGGQQGPSSELPADVANVASVVAAVPYNVLAQAALRWGDCYLVIIMAVWLVFALDPNHTPPMKKHLYNNLHQPANPRTTRPPRCGALARALQYFETYARAQHGGGLNPASATPGVSYGHEEVAFLLEVYGQLEEPDGIEGGWGGDRGGGRWEGMVLAKWLTMLLVRVFGTE
jgi:hypothetical protein